MRAFNRAVRGHGGRHGSSKPAPCIHVPSITACAVLYWPGGLCPCYSVAPRHSRNALPLADSQAAMACGYARPRLVFAARHPLTALCKPQSGYKRGYRRREASRLTHIMIALALAAMCSMIVVVTRAGLHCSLCYRPNDDCPTCIIEHDFTLAGRTLSRGGSRCTWCPSIGMCVQTFPDDYWQYSKMALEASLGETLPGTSFEAFCSGGVEGRERPFPKQHPGNVGGWWYCDDSCGGGANGNGSLPAPLETGSYRECERKDEDGKCKEYRTCRVTCVKTACFPSSYPPPAQAAASYCGAPEYARTNFSYTSLGETRLIVRSHFRASDVPGVFGKDAVGFETPSPLSVCIENNGHIMDSAVGTYVLIPMLLNVVHVLLVLPVEMCLVADHWLMPVLAVALLAASLGNAGSLGTLAAKGDAMAIIAPWLISMACSLGTWAIFAWPFYLLVDHKQQRKQQRQQDATEKAEARRLENMERSRKQHEQREAQRREEAAVRKLEREAAAKAKKAEKRAAKEAEMAVVIDVSDPAHDGDDDSDNNNDGAAAAAAAGESDLARQMRRAEREAARRAADREAKKEKEAKAKGPVEGTEL
eukprot:PLAT3797.2.p1 GENE.PLAT3797.2~~PLAT3797.2.p1  ORF type:complete len:590 (-),score=115.76 PLAT3797.2:188-1957(-)